MTNNVPTHSKATLLRASLAAIATAVLIVVCIVLPAEYNVDPTGAGGALGLIQLAQASERIEISDDSSKDSFVISAGKRSDSVDIVIPAGRGLEYKLIMEKHTHLEYQWSTVSGEALYFDFHGEPKGDTTGYFESFAITTSSNMKGSLTTPFAGSHGWYWKNKSDSDVVVQLSIAGHYRIKG